MSESSTTPRTADEPSIGSLVGKLSESLSRLIRDELQLLQAQIAEKGKSVRAGAGLLAGAAVFGLFGLGWLLTGAMLALATVLPYWAAALIVAGGVLLLAAVLGLVGKSVLGRAPTPQPKENIMKDVEAIKQGVAK
ncbi:phage holin family protein [Ruania halotolerans]|uniref:phage holin family protein n=1 Tax=Ruania halotolerans TaxID=2897773 RepID=UPI001E2EAFA3|nr:phage holin family protein [Ruania halotolerans]UFU05986.1 phage holin family protein [Ruania halotolerans]